MKKVLRSLLFLPLTVTIFLWLLGGLALYSLLLTLQVSNPRDRQLFIRRTAGRKKNASEKKTILH